MKKSNMLSNSNNKTFYKKINPDKKIKLNSKYFSLKFIPYNTILNNLLILTFFEYIYSLIYITSPFTVQIFSYADDKKGLLRDFLYKDILL